MERGARAMERGAREALGWPYFSLASLLFYWLPWFYLCMWSLFRICSFIFYWLVTFFLRGQKTMAPSGGGTGLFLGSQRRYQVHQTIWKVTPHSETGPEANKNGDTYVCITSSATVAETLSVSSERPMKGHLKRGCQVHQTIWKTTPHAEEQGLGAN